MMNKEFVTYEQALALKELGFNKPCFGYYYTLDGKKWDFAEKEQYYHLDDEMNIGPKFSLLVPLKQQVFRWFRDKYNMHHVITIADLGKYEENISNFQCAVYIRNPVNIINLSDYNTYEKAEQACLNKLIEIANGKEQG